MKGESRDRTAEVKAASGEFQIARRDFCDAFEQEAGRLFSARECWYCRYGDFGILTEHPTQNGVCSFACRTGGAPEPPARTEKIGGDKKENFERSSDGVSGAAYNETDNTIGHSLQR